mgnify:CR=1 FL=1
MINISIIIPHYNCFDTLNNCIISLNKSSFKNFETIIVNNNSTDNSINQISKIYPDIIIINSQKNLGYAGGCNLGAKYAKGKYLIFLNNDTEHESTWIEHLFSFMENNPQVSSVQPKIKNLCNKKSFDYAGGSGGFIDILCYPFSRGRIFNTIESDHGQYNNNMEIFWASGTAFMTRRKLFNNVSGFDTYFFAHMEEIDYHWKCQLQGYEVWVEPLSCVYHIGGKTLSYKSPYKTFLNHRNSMIILLSNYSIVFSLILIIPRILLELVSIVKDFLFMRFNHSLAQIAAIIISIIRIDIIIKRRLHIANFRTINDRELLKKIYKGSIIFDYFLLRKKRFSKINF